MKIIALRFKNINNLKGDNVLDFDAEPLSSAGIFAITGPTGSGKSTLLDVITLALFNRIPRFSKAITKAEIEGQGSVITHHTDEASASVTFEVYNRRYTSTWSVSRTKSGNLKDYEMFIYDETGTPLDLKKSEVPSKNEEIIGLEYEQFIKSIILSQGEFAKFLKSEKNERGRLLENITGTSIYRKIGAAAFEKYREVKLELEREQDRHKNIICLSPEERESVKDSITTKTIENEVLTKSLSSLTQIREVKTSLAKLEEEKDLKLAAKVNLDREFEAFKSEAIRLERYEKVSPHIRELTRFQDAQKRVLLLSESIEQNTNAVEIQQSALKKTIGDLELLIKENVQESEFKSKINSFEKAVIRMDQEMSHIATQGNETRQRINSRALNNRIQLDSKVVPLQAIKDFESQMANLEKLISEAGLAVTEDTDRLRSQMLKSKTRLEDLKKLEAINRQEIQLIKKEEDAREQILFHNQKITELTPLIASNLENVNLLEKNIALLQKQKQDALLIASLSEHRSQLISGEPCPLCGSTEHPFSAHATPDDQSIDIDIKQANEKLTALNKNLTSVRAAFTQHETSRDVIQKHYDQLLEDRKALIQSKDELLEKLDLGKTKEGADLEKEISELDSILQKSEAGIEAISKIKIVAELIKEFKFLDEILNKHKHIRSERQSMFLGPDVSTTCGALLDAFDSSSTMIARLKAEMDKDQKEWIATNQNLSQIEKELTAKLGEIGIGSIAVALENLISESELNQLKLQKDRLSNDRLKLETELKTLAKNSTELAAKDNKPELELATVVDEIVGLELKQNELLRSIGASTAKLKRDDEDRTLKASKAEQLAQLKTTFEKWSLLNKMIGDKNGNSFANFAQGLTLQNLLVFANKRLEHLSDRYLLDKPIDEGPLTVIDLYQGNIQRAVNTLSGGESFLVSLALALSLSDMASRNVPLESLFIDEGFGTLDQETLDVAMQSLEKLQSESQKMVGVISHVEALKERINVQVKLEKNAQGYSRIVVEG